MSASAAKKQAHPLPKHALRLLIVDDCPDNATSTAILLKSAGHQVLTARNGTEALMVAESFLPQAVLLDIGLPGSRSFWRFKKQTMASPLEIRITPFGE